MCLAPTVTITASLPSHCLTSPRRSVSVTAPFYSGTNAWGGRRLSSSDGGGANVGVNVNVPGSSSGGGSGSSSSGNNNKNNQQGQGQSQQQQQQGQQGQTGVNVKAPYTNVNVDAGKSGRCVRTAGVAGVPARIRR